MRRNGFGLWESKGLETHGDRGRAAGGREEAWPKPSRRTTGARHVEAMEILERIGKLR